MRPVLIDVVINPNQKLNPKLEFGKPIEDISPLLPREEFYSNMIIKPLEDEMTVNKSKSTEIN